MASTLIIELVEGVVISADLMIMIVVTSGVLHAVYTLLATHTSQ